MNGIATRALCLFATLLAPSLLAAPSAPRPPVLLGVDGCYLPATATGETWASEPWLRALGEIGANLLVFHCDPLPGAEANAAKIARLDALMRARGLRYMLNNETANWVKTFEVEPGRDEFAQADGTHRWDYRPEWLRAVLGKQPPALLGVTYDEPEHMQLTGHQFATLPDGVALDCPHLADTSGLDLETAFDRLTTAASALAARHADLGLRVSSEQVWPDLFHVYARAGWTITPKLLKENLSSVAMSVALGAARQYADRGAALWVSPDLWCRGVYPGHSPAALRSALLMGYWLGAEALYVENFDYPAHAVRHPEADAAGSLVQRTAAGDFELTKHGRVVREFFREYVPQHPRAFDWRDYRPRVAIVRLPDGDCGLRGTSFRDRLLGNPQHPADAASGEWLQLWPLLTHGVARPGAISLNNAAVYPEAAWPFFVPIDSVAVFDHTVSGPVLDSVECFLICGHALTAESFRAIAHRVEAGATAVIARRLLERHAAMPPRRKWIVVDSFADPRVAAALQPFLGPPDVARFRFKDAVVEFRATTSGDALEVAVRPAP